MTVKQLNLQCQLQWLTDTFPLLPRLNQRREPSRDAVIFLGDITQISGNEYKLAWRALEKNRRTTEGPLEESSLSQPVA